jgi:hypothetical protein
MTTAAGGQSNLFNLSGATAANMVQGIYGANDWGGIRAPDIVGQLRVDQAWGLAQLSVVGHNMHAGYYGATELTGHPEDKWGFAVQGALSIKNIPTGPGDVINVQGVYTDGATRYNIQDLASPASSNAIYGGTSLPGAYQSLGLGTAVDSVFGTGTGQQLVQTWGMRGGYTHNWDAYWNTSVYGAYAAVHYNDNAKALLCGGVVNGVAFGGSVRATFAGAGSAITTCNPDYNIGQVGVITRWTPVKNLTFSGEFVYQHLDQKMVGFVNAPSAAIAKPALVYQLRDQDTFQVLLRAQRNLILGRRRESRQYHQRRSRPGPQRVPNMVLCSRQLRLKFR